MPVFKKHKQIRLHIVKNAAEGESLKCYAVLAWDGAEFSDGIVATPDFLQELAGSVDLKVFRPKLIADHEDKSVKNIVGIMSAIYYEDGQLKAEFDVVSEEAKTKIMNGEWEDVSLRYSQKVDENGEPVEGYEIDEVSIVTIPWLKGAKLKPEKAEAEAIAAENAKDCIRNEKDCIKNEKEDIPADMVADAEIAAAEKEESLNECDDREERSRMSTENSKLRSTLVTLNARIKELERQAAAREREITVNGLLDRWQREGKTLPVHAGTEKTLLMSLNSKQLELYQLLKNDMAVKSFGRLSLPNAVSANRENPSEAADFERLDRKFSAYSNKKK